MNVFLEEKPGETRKRAFLKREKDNMAEDVMAAPPVAYGAPVIVSTLDESDAGGMFLSLVC